MFLCLECNYLFNEWAKVEFNGKEVCPLCGISKEFGKYRTLSQDTLMSIKNNENKI